MPQAETPETRLNKLEEIFTHHQVMLDELNGVIIELRGQLDRLQAKQQTLENTVQLLVQHQPQSEDPRDEKPPHY